MKRLFVLCLSLLLLLSMFAAAVLATDVTLECTYIPITQNGFVADTMNGVGSIYNLGGGPLCSELVERYYREVYGLTLQLGGAPIVLGTEEYWFEKTDIPQQGDILYASASDRGTISHYALCRSTDLSAQTVLLFEQNWAWDGKAGIDRVIPLDSCYTYYTLCSAQGRVDASDAHEDTQDTEEQDGSAVPDASGGSWYDEPLFDISSLGTPSAWALGYLEQAAQYRVLDGLFTDWRKPITRGEFAAMMVDAAEYMTDQYIPSDSVAEKAQAMGLMFGDGKGNFRMMDPLTREEAAVICTRLMNLCGAAAQAEHGILERYADGAQIASWAKDGVSLMTQMGLMSGTGSGFSPRTDLSVEQAVTLLVRVYDQL